ncbi:caspase-3-like [Hydra vulgaris]|uniref:Caspase-3-like n=1 Tax=Hydra vulgaris TaxID=6087 RepID=A0ABM4B6I8_HYDVU
MNNSIPKEDNIFQNGEFIQKVCEKVGRNWKELGRYLGVDEDDLDAIEEDEKRVVKRANEVIKKWKQKNENPTIDELCKALRKIPRIDIIQYVETLAENFQKQVNNPVQMSIQETSCHGADGIPKKEQAIEKYIFKFNPCGICVIISNNSFDNMKERNGTKVDLQRLDETFSMLNFEVIKEEDKTRDEMYQIIEKCGNKKDIDCFVCCILSHGSLEAVYGIDGGILTFKKMRSAIKNNPSNLLKEKPKIFFIQACQGDKYAEVYSESDSHPNRDNLSYLPKDADFYFSVATTPDNVALRHTVNGSPYIQTLCSLLIKNVSMPLLDILTKLNDEMRRQCGYLKEKPNERVVNISNTVFNTLNKSVYFEMKN